MKKIIIALDYDPGAEKVAQTGYELAKALQAEITLMHVIGNPAYYASAYSPIMGFTGFDETFMQTEDRSMHNEAKRFLEEVKQHLGDETIKISVLDGEVDEAIMSFLSIQKADMLVMGTHTRHGLDKLLMGNIAEKVLRHIQVPLVAVPTHVEETGKKQASA
ncbi:MAG: universal stress protein [Bacteroidota bacterium]